MNSLKEIKYLKDNELLTHFSFSVQKERNAIGEVITHLAEIDRRKLYLKEAYPTLFAYLTQKYHYSGGAAYRRIQVARGSRLFPEILGLLKEGKVNLMTLSLIQPHLNPDNGKELIEAIQRKSKSEVEDILSGRFPKRETYQDKIRRLPVIKKAFLVHSFNKENQEHRKSVVFPENDSTSKTGDVVSTGGNSQTNEKSEETGSKKGEASDLCSPIEVQEIRRVKIEFVADEAVVKNIERAKELLRWKYPEGKLKDIFNEALEHLLEKKDPLRRVQREKNRENKLPQPRIKEAHRALETRYIPQKLRLEIWERDNGQCTYRGEDGKRCSEKGVLELDHVQPFALGGKTEFENLRILCAPHNRWRGEKTFG